MTTLEEPQMQAVALSLSLDELACLLFTLRLPPLMGMGRNLFPEGTPEEVIKARLQAGRLALQARKLVAVKDGQLQIDTLIGGILGAWATATQMVVMTIWDLPESLPPVYTAFYINDNMIVENTLPAPGIFQFTAYAEGSILLNRVRDALGTQGNTAMAAVSRTRRDIFEDTLRKFAAGDIETASRQLADSGWKASDVKTFARLISAQTLRASVAVMQTEAGKEANALQITSAFDLLITEGGLFRMNYPPSEDNDQINVSSTTVDDVILQLEDKLRS